MTIATPAPAQPFPLLFSPLRLAGIELRNRVVFQPHFTALGSREGMPTDAHAAYYAERAKGGVGLIVFESQAIHPSGKMSRRFVNAWDPAVIGPYRRVTDEVHAHGAKIFGQLTHAGHTTLERPPGMLWAPTQMPEPSSHFTTKAIDADDIRAVIEGFGTSARNAVEGGFDGIEIKVAHDGLLRSFASPFFNRRTDGYGGSFANRMRLSVEVLEAIRKAIGPELPIGVRLCVEEFTPFGYDAEYGLAMAEHLQATGLVDYFNADAGSFSSFWMEIPPAAVPSEVFRQTSMALKKASRIPVVAFGRITPPRRAEEMLAAGEADLIGWARQLVADPDLANKMMAGRADLVRVCLSCNDGCLYRVVQEKAIRCVHNPSAGRERTWSHRLVERSPAPCRVVVVGGGPAGLKTAEIAALRGHRVTLLERERALGGQIRLAQLQPEHQTVGEVVAYLEAALAEHGVEIRLRSEATVESLLDLAPDVIILATGSEPNLPGEPRDGAARARELGYQLLPEIPGIDRANVVSVDRVLGGEVRPSGRVVLVDGNGHWEAVGTAEFLADLGCEVEVVAGGLVVGSDIEDGTRTLFYRRAAIKGIRLRHGHSLVEIGERRVAVAATFSDADAIGWATFLLMPGEPEWIEDVDWVVPVIGRRSRVDLYMALKADPRLAGVRIERVGDCVVPRLIEATIAEAFELARDL